jgi:hypothetical protein
MSQIHLLWDKYWLDWFGGADLAAFAEVVGVAADVDDGGPVQEAVR